MKWDPELEYDFSGLPLFQTVGGPTVTYFAWPSGGIEYEIMHVTLSDGGNPVDTDLRATRRQIKEAGLEVPPLSKHALEGISLAVIFGPKTGPKRAVRCLRKIVYLIEARGLVTGCAGQPGDQHYVKEFVKARRLRKGEHTSDARALDRTER